MLTEEQIQLIEKTLNIERENEPTGVFMVTVVEDPQ